MGETHASTERYDEPGLYEIRLEGHLDARWADWFAGMGLTHENDGTTVLSGTVADQAALHGLLRRVRDVGLPLVSVIRVEPDQPAGPTTEPRQALTDSRRE